MERRDFIQKSILGAIGLGIAPSLLSSCENEQELFFKISLAQWSLHRTLRAGKLTTLEFPEKAKKDFGIYAIEYVNQFFFEKAKNEAYLNELRKRSTDIGVENVLIMVDGEGDLAATDDLIRSQNIENHFKWVEAANKLGCHSIRVNVKGEGSRAEVSGRAIESLSKLSSFSSDYGINVIVENHGGYSCYGDWLSSVISEVNLPNCGTLPDFGNFYDYDRYKGVKEMMPLAKGVSAKSNSFTSGGLETDIDYGEMLSIVKKSGYTGYIGIEYEGPNENEDLGIRKTKDLLTKIGMQIA